VYNSLGVLETIKLVEVMPCIYCYCIVILELMLL
jgi:hypothetical protein